MKKILHKIRRKKTDEVNKPPTRITNETVAEHREQVIAGGRRFKYPIQYARHKLVINAIIIAIVAIGIFIAVCWWQLYKAQTSNTFFYRISQIAQLPVGSVDGEPVLFKDYLLNYRVSEHYLATYDPIKPDSPDGKFQLEYKKRAAMDIAINDAQARKIARTKNLSVSEKEIENSLNDLRKTANGAISMEASIASSRQVLGLSSDDLHNLLANTLLRSKAAFAIDDQANKIQTEIGNELKKPGADMQKISEQFAEKYKDSVSYGVTGLINVSSMFSGFSAADVAKLKKDEISNVLKGGADDGYFYAKMLDARDGQVNFAFIRIQPKEFANRLKRLKSENKINEYITIDIDGAQERARGKK